MQSLSFREVGVYEKHAKLDGVWRDMVIGSNCSRLTLLDLCGRDNLAGMTGSKVFHQEATANRKVFFIQRIETLATFLSHKHQIRFLQNFQMMTHGGLLNPPIQLFNDIIDTQPDAAEVFHDLLAGFIRKSFRKRDRIGL
jgi:hypothetical protein